MKKIFFALMAGSFPALAIMNGVCAQHNNFPDENIHFNKTAASKSAYIMSPGAVNPRAVKHFSQSYKNAANTVWITINDGVRASFTLNGVRNKVFYNRKGNWIASLKNYTEEKLSFDVRDMVKRNYYDDRITYIDEIETLQSGGIPTYIVHLEGKDDYKLISVCNGSMAVWKTFKKQQP